MPQFVLPPQPGLPAPNPVEARAVDALASVYRRNYPAGDWDHFLLQWIPVQLFDAVLDPTALAIPTPGFLHLLTASGYWTGAWLRRALREHPSGGFDSAARDPHGRTLTDALAESRRLLERSTDAPERLVELAEIQLPEQISAFGDRLGGLLEITEFPPPAATLPDQFVHELGLLWIVLETPALVSPQNLRPIAREIDEPTTAAWEALAALAAELRDPEIERARAIWNGELSLIGFDAEHYATWVAVAAISLEVAQAIALTTCQAVGAQDGDAGARALLAAAGAGPWRAAEATGLLDPARDAANDPSRWPRFAD